MATEITFQNEKISSYGKKRDGKIFLMKPTFFSPLTPPLGIALLKTFLGRYGYSVQCYDFNVDSKLWRTHHKYFEILRSLESITITDGYSKLWYILNAHLLSYTNGADHSICTQVLETIMPIYGLPIDLNAIGKLMTIADELFVRLEELVSDIDFSDFSVVGTSTYTTSLASSLFLLRRIKQDYPHIITVMGGGVFADDLALGSENLQTLVDEYQCVDHIILGEGELLMLELLEGTLEHKKVISIEDIQRKTLSMGEAPIPDFSDFDMNAYMHLSIEGARSCPFECSFCSETIQWGSYRRKPKNMLAQQMDSLSERYQNNTYFMGDSLMNPYIMDLSRGLLNSNTSILYDGYFRADKIALNTDRVQMWARSGLFRTRLGVESASADILNLMDKKTTPETISGVLKTLSNAGIRTTTYWIVGFPGETEKHFQETLDFIREHHHYIYELEAHPYYYYPYGQIGSRLYECAPLYPDHVSEVTKFRWWDVLGVQPTRLERYDRLRRITDLAAELGLPNIYSIQERYQAETRWRELHPAAHEVY